MQEEVKEIKGNAEKVKNGGIPSDIPTYFFISESDSLSIPNWQGMLVDYTEKLSHGEYQLLDAGHYLHLDEPELIASEMRKFLTSID